tara:strand:- start:11062 stop:11307 length:246 start_codon:yes stop_codon:yes gene_type:complete
MRRGRFSIERWRKASWVSVCFSKSQDRDGAAFGPEPTFTHHADAAPQLHQTGHSSMAQHFSRIKVRRAGPSCRSLLPHSFR